MDNKLEAVLYGKEHIRHQSKLKEIEGFCKVLNKHRIDKGKRFVLSADEGVMECIGIREDDLTIEYYKYIEGRTTVLEMEFFTLTVAIYEKYYGEI